MRTRQQSMGWTMKRQWGSLALAIAASLAWPYGVMAQAATEEQKEQKEQKEAEQPSALDREANTPEGTKLVSQRLATEFGVDEARITGLRDKQLGYGEIQHALSLAQQMPGGITDDNVNKILTMRQEQKMGWGKIAQELGTKLGPAVKEGAESATHPGSSSKPVKADGRELTGERAGSLGRQQGGSAIGMSHAHSQNAFGGANLGGRGNSVQAPGHNR